MFYNDFVIQEIENYGRREYFFGYGVSGIRDKISTDDFDAAIIMAEGGPEKGFCFLKELVVTNKRSRQTKIITLTTGTRVTGHEDKILLIEEENKMIAVTKQDGCLAEKSDNRGIYFIICTVDTETLEFEKNEVDKNKITQECINALANYDSDVREALNSNPLYYGISSAVNYVFYDRSIRKVCFIARIKLFMYAPEYKVKKFYVTCACDSWGNLNVGCILPVTSDEIDLTTGETSQGVHTPLDLNFRILLDGSCYRLRITKDEQGTIVSVYKLTFNGIEYFVGSTLYAKSEYDKTIFLTADVHDGKILLVAATSLKTVDGSKKIIGRKSLFLGDKKIYEFNFSLLDSKVIYHNEHIYVILFAAKTVQRPGFDVEDPVFCIKVLKYDKADYMLVDSYEKLFTTDVALIPYYGAFLPKNTNYLFYAGWSLAYDIKEENKITIIKVYHELLHTFSPLMCVLTIDLDEKNISIRHMTCLDCYNLTYNVIFFPICCVWVGDGVFYAVAIKREFGGRTTQNFDNFYFDYCLIALYSNRFCLYLFPENVSLQVNQSYKLTVYDPFGRDVTDNYEIYTILPDIVEVNGDNITLRKNVASFVWVSDNNNTNFSITKVNSPLFERVAFNIHGYDSALDNICVSKPSICAVHGNVVVVAQVRDLNDAQKRVIYREVRSKDNITFQEIIQDADGSLIYGSHPHLFHDEADNCIYTVFHTCIRVYDEPTIILSKLNLQTYETQTIKLTTPAVIPHKPTVVANDSFIYVLVFCMLSCTHYLTVIDKETLDILRIIEIPLPNVDYCQVYRTFMAVHDNDIYIAVPVRFLNDIYYGLGIVRVSRTNTDECVVDVAYVDFTTRHVHAAFIYKEAVWFLIQNRDILSDVHKCGLFLVRASLDLSDYTVVELPDLLADSTKASAVCVDNKLYIASKTAGSYRSSGEPIIGGALIVAAVDLDSITEPVVEYLAAFPPNMFNPCEGLFCANFPHLAYDNFHGKLYLAWHQKVGEENNIGCKTFLTNFNVGAFGKSNVTNILRSGKTGYKVVIY